VGFEAKIFCSVGGDDDHSARATVIVICPKFVESLTTLSHVKTNGQTVHVGQGCQIVYFQTIYPNLGNCGVSCSGGCWYILWTFGLCIIQPFAIFHGHLVYLAVIWLIFPRFGMLCKEKSGNPDVHVSTIHLFYELSPEKSCEHCMRLK
jgi:hypothetical protein